MDATLSGGTLTIELDSGDVHVYSLTGARAYPLRPRTFTQAATTTPMSSVSHSTSYEVCVKFQDGTSTLLEMGAYANQAGWANNLAGAIACVEDLQAAM